MCTFSNLFLSVLLISHTFILNTMSYQTVKHPRALAVQRATRSLGLGLVAKGDGARAQLSLPRSLPSVLPLIHSRYWQYCKEKVTCSCHSQKIHVTTGVSHAVYPHTSLCNLVCRSVDGDT